MATEGWVVTVNAVGQAVGGAPTGNLQQLFPPWVPAGVAKAGSNNGDRIRVTAQAALYSWRVESDGTNGGTVEIYDINGADVGADVSSGQTITNAQLLTALSMGIAKLIHQGTILGVFGTNGTLQNPPNEHWTMMHGIACRFSNGNGGAALGHVLVNLNVSGGYASVESRGGY